MVDGYEIHEDEDGTYSVVFAETGTPVVINGVHQTGLDIQDADELAESLQKIDELTAGRGTMTRN